MDFLTAMMFWRKVAEPTLQEMTEEELRKAEVGLMAAENEYERATHSLAMMQDKVVRLKARRDEFYKETV